MANILIFQPFTSVNHKHLSDTIERQFRFLKYVSDIKVYCLFDRKEKDAIQEIEDSGWIKPLVMDFSEKDFIEKLMGVQEEYGFCSMYVARTYFVPATDEHKRQLLQGTWDKTDMRYFRNNIPLIMSNLGVPLYQVIYDPLELNYIGLVTGKYQMLTSMNNVPSAVPHHFADIGYYDIDKEVPLLLKTKKFTFGGTAIESKRAALLESLLPLNRLCDGCQVYIKTRDFNNTVLNNVYEYEVSHSLFTYTIPSQDPRYVSFTRMLLALSQGTIPLIHPDNNLNCIFGVEFQYRDSLKEFFNKLIISVEGLNSLLVQDMEDLTLYAKELLEEWHRTGYYEALLEGTLCDFQY